MTSDTEGQWIVVEGSLSGGFSMHGPFATIAEAADYADTFDVYTWCVRLIPPVLEDSDGTP